MRQKNIYARGLLSKLASVIDKTALETRSLTFASRVTANAICYQGYLSQHKGVNYGQAAQTALESIFPKIVLRVNFNE